MGKPYNHQFSFAGAGGSAGLMICAACHKPIDSNTQDWVNAQKSEGGDWAYITHHRGCYTGVDGWAKIEAQQSKAATRVAAIIADLKAVADKHSVTSGYDLADLSALAFGDELEEYFTR